MAFAQEVGRLVVKLLGDDSQYQKMLKGAASRANKTGKKMTTMLTLPLLGFAASSVKAFADFDNAMTKSLSIMSTTQQQTEKMKKVALELGAKGTIGPKQLADAYYYLASAGFDAERSMRALPIVAKFATAGAFDMAMATDLLTDAQTALGTVLTDSGKTMEDLGDQIVKAAQLANASVQQFSESITADAGVAARNFGMEVETLMAVLGAYASAGKKGAEAGNLMGRALRLTTKSFQDNATAFKSMGIAVVDKKTGEFRNFIDIIRDMEKAFEGLTRPQISEALKKLGFAALAQKSILPLIGMTDQMKKFEEAQRRAGGAMESVYQKQLRSLTAQLKIVWNQLKVASIAIGSDLAPMIRRWAERLSGLVDWFRKLNPSTKSMIVNVGLFVAAMGPALIVVSKMVTLFGLMSSGTAAANLGLKGLAVVGIAMIIKGIYDANTAVQAFNTEMERSISLSNKLQERESKKQSGILEKASALTGDKKIEFLKKKLEQMTKEVQGGRIGVALDKKRSDQLHGSRREDRKGFGSGAFMGMVREVTGNKVMKQADSRLEESKARLLKLTNDKLAIQRELEKAITEEKIKQQTVSDEKMLDQKQLVDQYPLDGIIESATKKTKEWGDAIDWHVVSKFRGLKKQAASAMAAGGKFLSGGFGRGDDSSYRVNQAVQGGSMADYQSREFSSTYLAENKPKKKEDDTQEKQLEKLDLIADVLKKNLRPFGGIRDLFEIVTG